MTPNRSAGGTGYPPSDFLTGGMHVIYGWTDSVRLPRLGTIALGMKDERGVPKAVDYFVVPPEVQAVYGPQPRELDIIIPHDDLEVVMPTYLKRYGENFGLICRGDGKTAALSALYAQNFGGEYGVKWNGRDFVGVDGQPIDVEPGQNGRGWLRIPCFYRRCAQYVAGKCTEVAILNVMLYKVPGVLGVYSIDTGSWNSYQNITAALNLLRALLGRVSCIPLKLRVRMQQAHPAVGSGAGARQISTFVPVMFIDMGGFTLEKVLQLARERRLLMVGEGLGGGTRFELEPPDEDRKPDLLYPPALTPGVPSAADSPVPEPTDVPTALESTAGPDEAGVGLQIEPVRESAAQGTPPGSSVVQPEKIGPGSEVRLVALENGISQETQSGRGQVARVRARCLSGPEAGAEFIVWTQFNDARAISAVLCLVQGSQFLIKVADRKDYNLQAQSVVSLASVGAVA